MEYIFKKSRNLGDSSTAYFGHSEALLGNECINRCLKHVGTIIEDLHMCRQRSRGSHDWEHIKVVDTSKWRSTMSRIAFSAMCCDLHIRTGTTLSFLMTSSLLAVKFVKFSRISSLSWVRSKHSHTLSQQGSPWLDKFYHYLYLYVSFIKIFCYSLLIVMTWIYSMFGLHCCCCCCS